MATHEGKLDGAGLRIGVVTSRFNRVVTERLLASTVYDVRLSRVGEDVLICAALETGDDV